MKIVIVSLIMLSMILGVAALDEVIFKAEEDTDSIIEECNAWETNRQLLVGYEAVNVELKVNKLVVRRYHVLIDPVGEISAINHGNINDVDFKVTIPLSIAKEWIQEGPTLDYEDDFNRLVFYPGSYKDEIKERIDTIYADSSSNEEQ